jgi:hypothetical protein
MLPAESYAVATVLPEVIGLVKALNLTTDELLWIKPSIVGRNPSNEKHRQLPSPPFSRSSYSIVQEISKCIPREAARSGEVLLMRLGKEHWGRKPEDRPAPPDQFPENTQDGFHAPSTMRPTTSSPATFAGTEITPSRAVFFI